MSAGKTAAQQGGNALRLGTSDYDHECSLTEIADELAISKQRVEQLLRSGLFKMLVALTERGLSFADLNPSRHSSVHVYHR